MAIIKRTELDFFKTKALGNKEAVMYIRNGEIYFWCGEDKIVIDDPESAMGDDDQTYNEVGVHVSALDLSKDKKVNGFFFFWQKEEHYALAFIDHKRKHIPVGVAFGNGLND